VDTDSINYPVTRLRVRTFQCGTPAYAAHA
jgi:hypothetical protein